MGLYSERKAGLACLGFMNAFSLAFLGTGEIVAIVVVVLILFGAKKVPELMGGLGKGIKEFKKASRDVQDEIQQAIEEEPKPRPTPRPPSQTTHARSASTDPEPGKTD